MTFLIVIGLRNKPLPPNSQVCRDLRDEKMKSFEPMSSYNPFLVFTMSSFSGFMAADDDLQWEEQVFLVKWFKMIVRH